MDADRRKARSQRFRTEMLVSTGVAAVTIWSVYDEALSSISI
jgi:uncharacterized membrane protein YhiD involved in acid resistance